MTQQDLTFGFVLGAQKSGTTALYAMLKQHPGLNLAVQKETKFFVRPSRYEAGLDAFLREFEDVDDERPLIDIDPEYLCSPIAAEAIHRLIGPEARFVVILRDPANRALSQHTMERSYGFEKLSFGDALLRESNVPASSIGTSGSRQSQSATHNNYVERGRYHEQISRYLRWFPIEQFHVVLYEEDFVAQSAVTVANIAEFLGAARTELDVGLRKNDSYVATSDHAARVLRFLRWGQNPTIRFVRRLIPAQLRSRIGKKLISLNRSEDKAPTLTVEEHDRIIDRYFADDIDRTEELLGRSLDIWRDLKAK